MKIAGKALLLGFLGLLLLVCVSDALREKPAGGGPPSRDRTRRNDRPEEGFGLRPERTRERDRAREMRNRSDFNPFFFLPLTYTSHLLVISNLPLPS